MSRSIFHRPTGDLLVIMIAGTICFSIIATGGGIFILAIVQPARDTSSVIGALSDTINTMIGLLAGYIAGKSSTLQHESDRSSNSQSNSGTDNSSSTIG